MIETSGRSRLTGQVLGIGTDIVSVDEFHRMVKRTPEFLSRWMAPEEVAEAERRSQSHDPQHLCGNFAAKEALLKAFGAGLFQSCQLNEIEIGYHSNGKPYFRSVSRSLEEMIPGEKDYLLSISHCSSVAVAMVVIVGSGSHPHMT